MAAVLRWLVCGALCCACFRAGLSGLVAKYRDALRPIAVMGVLEAALNEAWAKHLAHMSGVPLLPQ
jgi:hypothetical protein